MFSDETATHITTDVPDSCSRPISYGGSQGSFSQYRVVFLTVRQGENVVSEENRRETQDVKLLNWSLRMFTHQRFAWWSLMIIPLRASGPRLGLRAIKYSDESQRWRICGFIVRNAQIRDLFLFAVVTKWYDNICSKRWKECVCMVILKGFWAQKSSPTHAQFLLIVTLIMKYEKQWARTVYYRSAPTLRSTFNSILF